MTRQFLIETFSRSLSAIGGRLGVAVMTLLVTGLVSGCDGGGQQEAQKQVISGLGAWAGYGWEGHVTSVAARWIVPRILTGSARGAAATWIGAQNSTAPGTPFVQVGTTEVRRSPSGVHPISASYYAFWSDASRNYEPERLFRVAPDDSISATLALRAGRWYIAIRDDASGAAARLTTRQDTRRTFTTCEWLQEDPLIAGTTKQVSYPTLTDTYFADVRVNGRTPTAGSLLASWMSTPRADIGPSMPLDATFRIGRVAASARAAGICSLLRARTLQLHVTRKCGIRGLRRRITQPSLRPTSTWPLSY